MFDTYLERITNEAYYNNEPDQRVLEEIEDVKYRLEDIEGDLTCMSYEEGMSNDMEDEFQELQCQREELKEKLEKLEGVAYGNY
jgi:U3 small nucleolar ribonucleoprotein component|nr:MAG TPA: hypothetical protein [Caudoviricetes sp.]